jgi:hypothetical protein
MPSKILLFSLVLAFVAYGCRYESQDALTPPQPPVCDTLNVTFEKTIAPLLAANCYQCHSNANAPVFANNIRLENYEDVQSHVSHLYGVVSWQDGYPRMPFNGQKLDDCSIAKIGIWVRTGAPRQLHAWGQPQ